MKLLKESRNDDIEKRYLRYSKSLVESVGADACEYEEIASKSVLDSDGFYTDYTMYYDSTNDRYVFVFGDKDIYRPEQGDFDYESVCETEEEAWEWYNDYNGFGDDEYLDESLSPHDKYIYAKEVLEAEDLEDLEEIVHEIFFYDKGLFAQINKFPKDKSFEEIKNNILKHLGYFKIDMNEGLADISRDFDFARDNWEKLNLGIDFDLALEKWNQTSKLAEKDFYAKPLYNKLAWDNMVEMFSNDDIKEEPEAAESEPLEQEVFDSDAVDESTTNESLKEDIMPYVKWVKRAKDGEWVMWGGSYSDELDPDFLYEINHPNFPNKEYNIENQYIDAMILPAGKDPVAESLKEDTVKTKDGKWTNKGKEGTHGKFKTKKEADAQRRAIWVNWNK